MNASFSETFPELLDQAREINGVLTDVAIALLFTGVVISAWRGTLAADSTEMVRAVVAVAVLAIVIQFFPDWVDEVIEVAHAVLEQIGADPTQTHTEFAQLITGADEGQEVGFWDVLWSDEGGIGKAFIYAFVLIMGKLAWLIMWLAYLLQHVIAVFAIAVSPGFLAMFALNATRGVAIKFLLSLLGVLLWPIGWAIADIMTDALLKLAAEDRIYVITSPESMLSGTQTLSFILILSFWIVVSTIASPLFISKSIESGSQIGTALLGSVAAASGQSVSYGIGAGVTASLAGASRKTATTAALVGGAGGLVSGAMGSSGVLVPAAIGTMAVAAAAPSVKPQTNAEIRAEADRIARNNRR